MPFPLRLSFPNRRWFSLNRTDFERLTAENLHNRIDCLCLINVINLRQLLNE